MSRNAILEFRVRASKALRGDPYIEAVGRLYGEGLACRNTWGADEGLSELIGVLQYIRSRHSGKEFVNKLKDAIAAETKTEVGQEEEP